MNLSPEHARQVSDSIGPHLAYLHRLRDRLIATGFTPQDKLYGLVREARNAVHALSVELHYMGCSGGVGRQGE